MLALLGGCSLIPEYAWKRFEDMLMSNTDEWLALDAEDKEALRARMAPWLDELRRERLPRYAELLRTLAVRARDGFDDADAAWLEEHAEPLYADAVESALTWIAPTLAAADAEQRRHLATRLREANAEFRRDYIERSHRARAHTVAEDIIDKVERWTGPLGPHQRRVVVDAAAELPDTTEEWYRYRLRMQAGLLALLHADADESAIREHLASWWVHRDTRRSHEHQATEALRAGVRALLVELHDALSPVQRNSTIRRLHSVADELDTLAANAPARASD